MGLPIKRGNVSPSPRQFKEPGGQKGEVPAVYCNISSRQFKAFGISGGVYPKGHTGKASSSKLLLTGQKPGGTLSSPLLCLGVKRCKSQAQHSQKNSQERSGSMVKGKPGSVLLPELPDCEPPPGQGGMASPVQPWPSTHRRGGEEGRGRSIRVTVTSPPTHTVQ